MADEHQRSEKQDSMPAPRTGAGIVSTWLETQRRTNEMLNPPVLRMIDPAWMKTVSGSAAMHSEVTKLFSARDLNLRSTVFADFERNRRILAGINPIADAAREMRALAGVGVLPAIQEATLATERIAQLIKPIDFSAITRDLTGISDAVASIASMTRLPAFDAGLELGAIATSALGSWRTYLDALPPTLDFSDLFNAQAATRGILGITATSAILLGDDEAVEIAEEWELAPAETRDRMRDGLRRISPRLLVRLDGAWDAVTHAGPDSASQAANSAIELIDWTLRLACDRNGLEMWILDQPKPSMYRDDNGRPTRQAKIRYLLRECDFEGEFVAATVRNLDALRGELQKLKHTHGSHQVDAVARLLPSVEAVLFLIVE